jgi:hypothetical protein
MFILNVTTKVSHDVAQTWLEWMKQEHIPALIKTGCFLEATILFLVESSDEEGLTYAVQYKAKNKADYDRYMEEFSKGFREQASQKWGDRIISFRTLMEIVH